MLGSPDDGVLGDAPCDDDGIIHGFNERTQLVFTDGFYNLSNDGMIEITLLGDSLGTDDETELGYLDGLFDGIIDINLDDSTLGVSLESTDGSIPVNDEVITMGSPNGEVLGVTLGYDGITIELDKERYLVFSN